MTHSSIPNHHQSGFTLVELVITIVLGGIVAAMTTSILTQPIEAYIDSSRRAIITDVAESALRRMQRDIRRALPNSIRITNNGQTLELLHLVDGGRYRRYKSTVLTVPSNPASPLICIPSNTDSPCDILDFSTIDTSFDVIGELTDFSSGNRVVVYPLGNTGSNAYAGDNISLITNTSTSTHLEFSDKQFPLPSPQQRFFIVDTPITYHCNLASSTLKDRLLVRYQGYDISEVQSIPPAAPLNGDGDIQANHLANCNFKYNLGSSTRSGLVSLEIKIADETGESVSLIHQIHIDNQP